MTMNYLIDSDKNFQWFANSMLELFHVVDAQYNVFSNTNDLFSDVLYCVRELLIIRF